jgi:hydroxymethylbilane synthase
VRVRLGARGSRLALTQAEQAAGPLRAMGVAVEIMAIRTSGDRLGQAALADFGGKALFVKEIDEALAAGEIDLAVHSLKDVPAVLAAGLCLAAYPRRDDPRDALVSRAAGGLAGLPAGAVVGSSSLRRQILLRAERADLRVEPIRGNVDTRLQKLAEGHVDALVVAQAGLNRLGVRPPNASPLPPEMFVPAVGQGILALEARAGDGVLLELLRRLDHTETRAQAEAERSFLLGLGASCRAPVAGWALVEDAVIVMRGLVAGRDGRVLRGLARGPAADAAGVGRRLADDLLGRGAADLMRDDDGAGGSAGVRASA